MVDYVEMAVRKSRENAEKASKGKVEERADKTARPERSLVARLFRWLVRTSVILFVLIVAWVGLYRFVNPPVTYLMVAEWRRLGDIDREWVGLSDMSSHMPLAAAAAEDARFCQHNGFDFEAIREALADKTRVRGASTITQQVAKNVFLWPGRTWVRKGLEAGFTVLIEMLWPKHRIIEVYLNIAEFDEGVFGVQAASRRYFGTDAASLSLREATRLAGVLPNPKVRDAANPTSRQRRRAARIASGANTLRVEGGACLFDAPAK